jgi:hypothetical protein
MNCTFDKEAMGSKLLNERYRDITTTTMWLGVGIEHAQEELSP